jgi:hypothetical protein
MSSKTGASCEFGEYGTDLFASLSIGTLVDGAEHQHVKGAACKF